VYPSSSYFSLSTRGVGYEVAGMISFLTLKAAMQLDHSKDMSVYAST
jgi:hypothetical protein